MRLFYKNWDMLDGNSSVATDELSHAINFGDRKQSQFNSSVATDELQIVSDTHHKSTCKAKQFTEPELSTNLVEQRNFVK
jgi:hypothetical protein